MHAVQALKTPNLIVGPLSWTDNPIPHQGGATPPKELSPPTDNSLHPRREVLSPKTSRKMPQADQAASKDLLKVIFHPRPSSTQGRLSTKVVLHLRSSSTKGCLPPQVVFHQRLSFTKGCLPPKVVFHQRSSFTDGRLLPKVVFHQRLSTTKGCLPSKFVSPNPS